MNAICLYNLEQAGLVIDHPSGLSFFNLGGGDGQQRFELEGFFVPISNDPCSASAAERLCQQLADCCRGKSNLNSNDASTIDDILQQLSATDLVRVDRRRLTDSQPGWVWVEVCAGGDFSQLQGFGECRAILTWPASR